MPKNLDLMRLTVAGSVDDGKSTLIGRLLYDIHAIYEDQILAVKKASEKSNNGVLDLSLFTDGLSAEREQKITIDVAYRYFSTPKRRFVVADVPGHEQYTRNMACGASTADIAIILVDASKGPTVQTKRHLFVASLFAIPHIAIAINKMDSVGYNQKVFENIKEQLSGYLTRLKITDLHFMPMSALSGDMVVNRGQNMAWYKGPTLFEYLNDIESFGRKNMIDFRFPVQMVARTSKARAYLGTVESGIIKTGEEIIILPSGFSAKIESLFLGEKKLDQAFAGEAIGITLDRERDLSRGEMIARPGNKPLTGNFFEATVCWFDDKPLKERNHYYIKQTTKVSRMTVEAFRYKIDIASIDRVNAKELGLNEIGRLQIRSAETLCFDPFNQVAETGSFIIIDENTGQTVGAGVIIRKIDSGQESSGKGMSLRISSKEQAKLKELQRELAGRGFDVEVLDDSH